MTQEISDKEQEQRDCSHDNLEFFDIDFECEVIVEDFKCQGCGATIVKEYGSPTQTLVEYAGGDTETLESQKTVDVYEFEELSEEAQEYAIEQERDRRRKRPIPMLEDQIRQAFIRKFEECDWLELRKDEDFNVRYDLSYSQGSGMSMVGDVIWTDDQGAEWLAQIRTKRGARYQHKHSITVKGVDCWNHKAEKLVEEDESNRPKGATVMSKVRKWCDDVEEIGYDIIEDHRSEKEAERHIREIADKLYFENGKEVQR